MTNDPIAGVVSAALWPPAGLDADAKLDKLLAARVAVAEALSRRADTGQLRANLADLDAAITKLQTQTSSAEARVRLGSVDDSTTAPTAADRRPAPSVPVARSRAKTSGRAVKFPTRGGTSPARPGRTNPDSPLGKLRVERGLSQAKLARLTKLSRGTISRYESGIRGPSGASLHKLAEALDITAEELWAVIR